MKNIWTWVVILLIGIAIIAVYPFLPVVDTVEETGFLPAWLIVIGYALAGIGAAGAFLAWVMNRAR